MGLTMTIDEMEEMGNPVHYMTRDARDYLMKRGYHENTKELALLAAVPCPTRRARRSA